jgi:hypothetical protein
MGAVTSQIVLCSGNGSTPCDPKLRPRMGFPPLANSAFTYESEVLKAIQYSHLKVFSSTIVNLCMSWLGCFQIIFIVSLGDRSIRSVDQIMLWNLRYRSGAFFSSSEQVNGS